ncbi:hypothetical protein [Amycolatopsis plumensis]|uniref:hypothetical protein n=1 Tax=Amycolatopsis plumensis TaxID=236508 RepID=UPI0036189F0B
MGENAGWAPSGWPLWALPGRVRVLVLGVVLAVFGLMGLAARTVPTPEQWTAAGWLAAAALRTCTPRTWSSAVAAPGPARRTSTSAASGSSPG